MIQKWYEVTCDYCERVINHYIGRKPTREEIEHDGGITTATKQFCCKECYIDWSHDKRESQYCNLKQNGSIHQ